MSKTLSIDCGVSWRRVIEIRTALGNWPWPARLESQRLVVVAAVADVPPLVVAEPLVLVVPLAAVPLLVVEAVEAVPPEPRSPPTSR